MMRRPDRDRFRAAHVGFIFQMFNLIPYLPLLDNVLLPLECPCERRMNLEARRLQPRTEARRLLGALGREDAVALARPVLESRYAVFLSGNGQD